MLRMASQLSKLFFVLVFLLLPTTLRATSDLPYYFPEGVTPTNDPLNQFEQYLLVMTAMGQCYWPDDRSNPLLLEENVVRVETDLVSTSSHTKNPANMVVVLDHHVKLPDGRVRVTTSCGQRVISQEMVDISVNDLVKQAKIAAERNNVYYEEVIDLAVQAIANVLDMDKKDVLRQLDERVPGTDVSFREYWLVPMPSRASDFVPRELHLGSLPQFRGGILGVTWLNTGLVYYNPIARVDDYIMGTPSVLEHEEVHANVNLQRFPFSQGLDLETGASIPSMLAEENKVSFSYHGYARMFRQLAKAYTGYPFDEVFDRVMKFDAGGNYVVDAEKYRYFFNELERVKTAMKNSFKETLAEYYGKQVWWLAMHETMGQQDAVFKIMMASQYDLTSLGGKEETMHLMKVHEQEIFKAAEKAFNEQRDGEGEPIFISFNIPPALIAMYEDIFSQEERARIESYFRAHPEKLEEILQNPDAVLTMIDKIFNSPTTKGGAR